MWLALSTRPPALVGIGLTDMPKPVGANVPPPIPGSASTDKEITIVTVRQG